LKDLRGKNVYNLAGDYEEGLEDEYEKFMERYGGRDKFNRLVKEGKIKSKYIMDTVNVYDNVFGYVGQVKENQKKEIDRIQKKIDDELKGKIVPPGPHGEPYDAPIITRKQTVSDAQVHHHSQDSKPSGDGNQGNQGSPHSGSSYSRGDYGGRGHHWAKGGIVDLL